MPPFLLISAVAYLAPSTSPCASADSTPVSGLTMPSLTVSAPSALMTYGAPAIWLAPSAKPALSTVRRPTGTLTFDISQPPWWHFNAGFVPDVLWLGRALPTKARHTNKAAGDPHTAIGKRHHLRFRF